MSKLQAKLNSSNGNLSVEIHTTDKEAIVKLVDSNGNSMSYALTDKETEKLGTALLKCHAKFIGKHSFITMYQ